jgi:hypothetical protein
VETYSIPPFLKIEILGLNLSFPLSKKGGGIALFGKVDKTRPREGRETFSGEYLL